MASAAKTYSTLLLVDQIDESSLARYKIHHAGSRQSFSDEVSAILGDAIELQYLVDSQWLTANQFLTEERGIQLFAPKHVRCTSKSRTEETPLAIAWRKFRSVTFAQGLASDLMIGAHRVALPVPEGDCQGPDGATGKTLWDGAILLAKFLSARPELVKGRSCLELGAGQGLAGISAGLLGASEVVLTDLPYSLPWCNESIALNSGALAQEQSSVRAEALDWFAPPAVDLNRWSVVLAADVVWLVELVLPFVRTLEVLAPPGSSTSIIFSYQRRGADADTELWSRLKEAQFNVEGPLTFEPFGTDGEKDGSGIDLGIYILKRP